MDKVMPKAVIRVTAKQTYGKVLTQASWTTTTDDAGAYSFPLVNGLHKVEVNYLDEFYEVGTFIVDAGTPSPISIGQMLRYSTPVVPPVILTPAPDWAALHAVLLADTRTTKQSIQSQVVDGSTSVSDTKQLWLNEALGASMGSDSLATTSGQAKVITQPRVYEDANLNRSVALTTGLEVGTATGKDTLEVYLASNGDVTAKESTKLTLPHTSMLNETSLDTSVKHTESFTLDAVSSTTVVDIAATSVKRTKTDTVSGASTVITDMAVKGYYDEANVFVPKNRTQHTLTSTHSDGVGSSFKDAHTLTEDAAGATTVVEESVLTSGTKEGSIRTTNTGVKTSHEVNVDHLSVNTGTTPIFEVDTATAEVKVHGTLILSNPAPFKGQAGDTVVEVYRYSPIATMFPDDGNWHAAFVTGDYFRISNVSTNGVVAPTKWSAPAKLAAKDGADGDTEYWEYHYSTDGLTSWHPTLVDGDLFRRERLVINSVAAAWSTPARIAGTNGADGKVITIEYEYSVNGLTIWHNNFTTGDHFRRERVVTYKFVGDTTPVYDIWSNPAKVVPVKGVDYLDGYNQATVFMYLRKTTALDTGDNITGDVQYNFTTRAVTGAGLGTWSTSIPTGSADIYVAAAGASGTATTETIADTEWSYGLFSSSAINSVPVTLYQRSVTLPTAPTADTTYTFSTGVLAGTLGGWSQTIPTGVDDLYACVATAISQSDTDVIGSGEWAVSLFNNSAQNHALLSIYRRAVSAPTPPTATVTYTFATGSLVGVNNGWTTTIPSGSDTLYIATATALSSGLTDSIISNEWAVAALTVNGNQGHSIILYQSALTRPASPIGDTSYNFSTGASTFANANGWTKNPPNNSTGTIWSTQATALATAPNLTDTIADTEWSVAEVFTEAGIQAATVQLFKLSATDLVAGDRPTNLNTYDFATSTLTTTPNNGWATTIPANPSGLPLWSTNAGASTIAVNTTDGIPASEWAIPVKLAQSGGQSAIVEIYQVGDTAPALPTVTTNYTFETGVLSNVNNGWTTAFPTNTGKVWMSHAIAFVTQGAIAAVDIVSTLWAAPELYAANGAAGDNGSGWYTILNTTGIFPSDAVATAGFVGHVGRSPVLDDHLTYAKTDGTNASVKRFNGSIWVAPSQIIDGDLLVTNTITGNHISSTTTITAGAGSTQAGMNGADTGIYNGWRLWAGSATPSSAAFRVNSIGKLWASGAVISGAINATSLTFTGGTIPSAINNSNAVATSAADATTKANAAQTAATTVANTAQGTANTAVTNAATAQSTANTANTAANASNTKWGDLNANYPAAGKIQIKSDNYVAGTSGWAIDSSGVAEFRNVAVRGSVYATTGVFDNCTINASCTIKGALAVEQLTGDLISVINKTAATVTKNYVGIYSFATVDINVAFSKAQVLRISSLNLDAAAYLNNTFVAKGRLKITGPSTYYSPYVTATSVVGPQGPSWAYASVVTGSILYTIPANWTGRITLSLQTTLMPTYSSQNPSYVKISAPSGNIEYMLIPTSASMS